jgi:hypothetical protein
MSDAKEETKTEEFDAQKAYQLHVGRSLYHVTRPVQLAPDELPEDFQELGQRDVLLIAKHKTKDLFRVTPIKKDGTHGVARYYATWGEQCPNTKKAKDWEKAREIEYMKGLYAYELCIARAAAKAKRTGANLEAACNEADEQWRKKHPTFCAEF